MAAPIKIVVSANTGGAESAIKRVTTATRTMDKQVRAANVGVNQFGATTRRSSTNLNRWAKGALQQAGYQIGDYAVQVANGTSKMQAFGQQGSQLLGIFGPVGAILGAGVAIFSAIGVAASKSGKSLSGFSSILGSLAEPFERVIESVKSFGAIFGSVGPIILANVDTLIIAGGLLASWYGVKVVASMIAASGASGVLSASLVTMRAAVVASTLSAGRFSVVLVGLKSAALLLGASLKAVGLILMRFLPIALLLGVAKLIELFLRLKEGAGGLGQAMHLLANVLREMKDRFVIGLGIISKTFVATAASAKSNMIGAFASIVIKFNEMTTRIATGLNELFGAVGVDLNLTGLADDAAKGWQTAADEAGKYADEQWRLVKDWGEHMRGPLTSWEKLKDAIKAGTTDITIFGTASEEAGDKAKKASEKLTDAMKAAQDRIQSLSDTMRDSMSDAFKSMIDGTKSAKDAFRDMARAIISKLFDILVVQQLVGDWSAKTGTGTGIIGGIMGTITGKRAMGGPMTTGKAYMVGERGPEIVVPSRNSHVVSNGSGGGGIVVNQTINVTTGVQQTVRAEIMSLMPRITENTKMAVLDAKQRGGAFGRAL